MDDSKNFSSSTGKQAPRNGEQQAHLSAARPGGSSAGPQTAPGMREEAPDSGEQTPGTGRQAPDSGKRTPGTRKPFRLLRLLGRACAIALGLTVLLSAGLAIYLRTEHGAETVRAAAVSAVNHFVPGLELEIDALSGPLPENPTLRGVRLRDSGGLWLSAERIHLVLDLGELSRALLKGTLLLSSPLTEVDGLHLVRLPDIPGNPERPAEPPPPAPLTLLPSWLHIQAANLDLRGLVVEPEVSVHAIAGNFQGSASLEAQRGSLRLGFAAASPENAARLPENVAVQAPRTVPGHQPSAAAEPAAGNGTPKMAETDATGGNNAATPTGTAAPPDLIQAGIPDSGNPAAKQNAAQTAVPPESAAPVSPDALFSLRGQLVLNREGPHYNLEADLTDSFLTRQYVPGMETAHLRLTLHCTMPLIPPLPGQEISLDARADIQIPGKDLPASGRHINLQAVSTYDGTQLRMGPVRAVSRDKKAALDLLLAAGFAPEGSGLFVKGSAEDLGSFFAFALPGKPAPAAGNLNFTAYSAAGKNWWQEFFVEDFTKEDVTRINTAQAGTPAGGNSGSSMAGTAKDSTSGSKKPESAGAGTAERTKRTRDSARSAGAAADGTEPGGSASTAQYIFLDITSPALRLPGGDIKDLQLHADAHGTGIHPRIPLLPARLAGKLDTRANVFEKGPLQISTAFSTDLTAQDGPPASLSNLEIRLPGSRLTGGLALKSYTENNKPLIEGALDALITDWDTLSRLTGYAAHGRRGAASLKLETPRGEQHLALKAELDGFASADASISRLDLDARAENLYSLLNPENTAVIPLTVRLRLGKSTAAGITMESASFDVTPRAEGVNFDLAVHGPLALATRGDYTFTRRTLHFSGSDLTYSRPEQAKLGLRISPFTVGFTDGISLSGLKAQGLSGGSLNIDARFSEEKLLLNAAVRRLPLNIISSFAGFQLPDGDIEFAADLSGTPENPAGTMRLQLKDIRPWKRDGLDVVSLPESITLDGKLEKRNGHVLRLSAAVAGLDTGPGDSFTASASLPLRFSPLPEPDPARPASADIFWRGNASSLWHYLPVPGLSLTGRAQAEFHAAGALEHPHITTALFLGSGHLVDQINGIQLQDIDLELRFDSRGDSLLRLQARDTRGGYLGLNGSVFPDPASPANFHPDNMRLEAHGIIQRLRPLHRDDIKAELSGAFNVTGAPANPQIDGLLRINEAVYTIPEFSSHSWTELPDVARVASFRDWIQTHAQTAPPAPASGGTLNLQVSAPGKIFIRGSGLNSEWRTSLNITGPLLKPVIVGHVQPVRGTFDALGKEFNFKRGAITFTGAWPPLPTLDLGLDYSAQNITAEILIRGPARKPRLDLSSTPALPRDEVMAQILFNKNASELNRFQLIQAANAAAMLVKGGPGALDVIGKTRDLLGFEVLRLGSSGAGTATRNAPKDASVQGEMENTTEETPTLEAGKYLSDTVYVGVEQGTGAQNNTTVRVDIDVLPNISVSGRTSNESSNVGINWKMDY